MVTQPPPKNPTLAAVLSFLINGLGQVYNGQIGKGILIFVVQIINVLLMSIVIGFITTPIVWIWSIYDAYKEAQRINTDAAKQVIDTTKVCPRCAERVNSGARVCHFCHYEFMPDVTPEGAQPLALPAAPMVPVAPQPAMVPAAAAMGAAVAVPQPAVSSAMKYCPQCGAQAAVAANFCLQCGTRFEAAPSAVPSAEGALPASWLPESAWPDATEPNRAAASDVMDALSDAEAASETPAYYDDSPLSAEVAGGLAAVEAPDELS
jgi:TM2 domain-containing membrane protein YozV